MITLHAYVLRELLKTFGLTILALTALFTMGGGLYNVVRSPGVTATSLLSEGSVRLDNLAVGLQLTSWYLT